VGEVLECAVARIVKHLRRRGLLATLEVEEEPADSQIVRCFGLTGRNVAKIPHKPRTVTFLGALGPRKSLACPTLLKTQVGRLLERTKFQSFRDLTDALMQVYRPAMSA
jgi:hypothetical protein